MKGFIRLTIRDEEGEKDFFIRISSIIGIRPMSNYYKTRINVANGWFDVLEDIDQVIEAIERAEKLDA